MHDLPGIVMRATGIPAAMASDLAVAGGILRCTTCETEQPLGDIAGYLAHGWPVHCGLTMAWVTLKFLAAESREVPDGYELVAVVSRENWRIETGRTCCRVVAARARCGAPAVAVLNRPRHLRASGMYPARTVEAWYGYCLAHLYGNWIESDQVMHWILREKASGD